MDQIEIKCSWFVRQGKITNTETTMLCLNESEEMVQIKIFLYESCFLLEPDHPLPRALRISSLEFIHSARSLTMVCAMAWTSYQ